MSNNISKISKIIIHLLIISIFIGYIGIIELQNKNKNFEMKILKFGPTSTKKGEVFNKQPEGEAALWFIVDGLKNTSSKVIWGKTPLPTAIYLDKNLATANVPDELFKKEGNFEIYILDPENNIKSNKVIFSIH